MRILAVLAACLCLSACGVEGPPIPPGQPGDGTVLGLSGKG